MDWQAVKLTVLVMTWGAPGRCGSQYRTWQVLFHHVARCVPSHIRL